MNCEDCTHLKAKIPITGTRRWINYRDGVIRCIKGHLNYRSRNMGERTFSMHYYRSKGPYEDWIVADHCPDYDGEDL